MPRTAIATTFQDSFKITKVTRVAEAMLLPLDSFDYVVIDDALEDYKGAGHKVRTLPPAARPPAIIKQAGDCPRMLVTDD